MAAIARWLASARLSKIRSCSCPRSIAWSTTRCVEFSGVMTRSGLDVSRRPSFGHVPTHTPQPRHAPSSSRATFRRSCFGSLADTSESASTGQASTHFPQPLQAARSTARMKLLVWTGCRNPNRRAAMQRLAAAAAAVADERHALARVLAELHQAPVARLLQEVEALGRVHLARHAVAHERRGGGVERHADVERRVARLPDVLHLVPAVAEADADRASTSSTTSLARS